MTSSTSSKKTKKSAASPIPEIPDSFLDVPDWIHEPSEPPKIPDLIQEIVTTHVSWLQQQKERNMELLGEKAKKKKTRGAPPPLDHLLLCYPQRDSSAAPANKEPSLAIVSAPPHQKPLLKSVARLKGEHESPRLKLRGTPSAPVAAPATPHRSVKAAKDVEKPVHPTEDKCLQAIERKQVAALEKTEKIKRGNEEKKRKVDARRREQEAESEKKRLEQLKKENASPARFRIAATVGIPSRVAARTAPNTPSTVVRAKVQLFPVSTPTRTPGHAPSKVAKIDKPDGAGALITDYGSAPRDPKRKPVVRAATPGLGDQVAKLPSTSKAAKKTCTTVVVKKERLDNFAATQLKLLMEHDEQKSKEIARLEEEERLRAEEEERQRKEERRRLKQEEEKLKRKRQEEKQRREEEERRLQEEERLRTKEEEARRLAAEDDEMDDKDAEEDDDDVELEDGYEKDIVQKLNDSNLEEATETTEQKIYLPSTAENYNIKDLSSGDETDDETAPRKQVPSWADWTQLTKIGSEQAKIKNDYKEIYGAMGTPDLEVIFKPSKVPPRQRGSSAHWSSPATNPSKGKSRFLAQQHTE